MCSCSPGYHLASNGHGCIDIDECAEGIDNCTQNCTNTFGSYRCSCEFGYRLASDGWSCLGKHFHQICRIDALTGEALLPNYADIDECEERTDQCTHVCTNTLGSYYCSCNNGYRVASNHYECEGGLCEHCLWKML